MAKIIPRKTKRITYSSEIRTLKNKPFNEEQLSIIKGSLLGDGGLQEAWSGTSKNYRFAKMHSIKQKNYVDWVYKKLKPFILTPPWLYKPTQSIRLRTISHPELTKLKNQFYDGKKKILPKNIRDIISDPIALAIWFMDDGNIIRVNGQSYGCHINTQSFTESENRKLLKLFKKIWGIDCTTQRNNGKQRLYVRSKNRSNFVAIVSKHIIPSMKYKLG